MLRSQLLFLFGFTFLLSLLVGCGGPDDGTAKPAADMNELQQFLEDNPELNVDIEEEDMDVDLAE